MATSKAKRLTVLAQPRPRRSKTQPKPEDAAVIPVRAHVYRSIAELNSGFEKVVQELQTLGGMSLFRSSGLGAMRELICRMRAQANRDFARTIHERETRVSAL
jgi:hypothetical protein